jgi:hypothetical protein
MIPASQATTRHPGRATRFWRALWVIAALAALVFVILSLPGYLQLGRPDIPIEDVPAWISMLEVINPLGSLSVVLLSLSLAGLLFWRRSSDRMALFVSYFLLGYATILAGPLEQLQRSQPTLAALNPNVVAQPIILPGLVALVGMFPDGRFVPAWMRWTLLVSLAWSPLSLVVPCCNMTQVNPWLATAYWLTALSLVLLGAYAQFYRYRWVSTQAERQQTKWVLWGLALYLLLLTVSSIPYAYFQSLPAGSVAPGWAVALSPLWWLALSVLPLSLAVGVVRYHLWDIDVLIRRTLIYTLLTGLLVLAYWGGVAGLQGLLRPLTGEGRSPIATVLSTLTVAALFAPLRRLIQRAIDRRFYRRKYDAARILDAFGSQLRDDATADLGQLAQHLLSVVQDTMQPTHVSLWLRSPTGAGQGSGRRPA